MGDEVADLELAVGAMGADRAAGSVVGEDELGADTGVRINAAAKDLGPRGVEGFTGARLHKGQGAGLGIALPIEERVEIGAFNVAERDRVSGW
jgi:hypothetical protein